MGGAAGGGERCGHRPPWEGILKQFNVLLSSTYYSRTPPYVHMFNIHMKKNQDFTVLKCRIFFFIVTKSASYSGAP